MVERYVDMGYVCIQDSRLLERAAARVPWNPVPSADRQLLSSLYIQVGHDLYMLDTKVQEKTNPGVCV